MGDKTYKQLCFMFVLSSIFIFICTIGLWNSYRTGINSKQWKKVNGIITSSEIISESGASIDDQRVFYAFRVSYKYKINDNNYEGHSLSRKPQGRSKEASLIKKKQYPINKEVVVYYNPNNPKQAVLETGSETRIPIIFSTIFIILGLLSYLFWRKSIRE